MNIEVGMYIRKNSGVIYQIKESDKHILDIYKKNNCNLKELEENDYDMSLFWIVKNIKKVNKNIIELIEVGDYVNGKKIIEIRKSENGYEYFYFSYCPESYVKKEDYKITEILTHEQYSANVYRVGGKE